MPSRFPTPRVLLTTCLIIQCSHFEPSTILTPPLQERPRQLPATPSCSRQHPAQLAALRTLDFSLVSWQEIQVEVNALIAQQRVFSPIERALFLLALEHAAAEHTHLALPSPSAAAIAERCGQPLEVELTTNPFLSLIQVRQRLLAWALQLPDLTAAQQEALGTLRRQLIAELREQLRDLEGDSTPLAVDPTLPHEPTLPSTPETEPLVFDPLLLGRDGDIFAQANHFVQHRQYRRAIKLLQQIPPETLQGSEASTKITEIANLAVKELRTEAATAFAKARSVGDRATRIAYLTDAEQYLKQAADLYPESTQQATVGRNLTVIRQALSDLQPDDSSS